MREKEVEKQLITDVKKRGGICVKWASGWNGAPDRLIFMPDGKFGMVEVKAPGKKPRPLQISRHKKLKNLGQKVFVLDNKEQIGGILDEIQAT